MASAPRDLPEPPPESLDLPELSEDSEAAEPVRIQQAPRQQANARVWQQNGAPRQVVQARGAQLRELQDVLRELHTQLQAQELRPRQQQQQQQEKQQQQAGPAPTPQQPQAADQGQPTQPARQAQRQRKRRHRQREEQSQPQSQSQSQSQPQPQPQPQSQPQPQPQPQPRPGAASSVASSLGVEDDEGEGEQEGEGAVEEREVEGAVFVPYQCRSHRLGEPHPGAVKEAASLAAVPLPLARFPLADSLRRFAPRSLSALQIEGVLYACQRHQLLLRDGRRAGFFLGDSTGVGKGRQLASVIFDSWLRGRRRHVWVSVAPDLHEEARRDLRDVGGGAIQVLSSLQELDRVRRKGELPPAYREGVLFTTYASLASKFVSWPSRRRSRLTEVVAWCGGEKFDGCIVLDECHRAKHAVTRNASLASKSGRAVIALQRALPRARVVYSSATGASDVHGMGFMERLGLWGEGTEFVGFNEFCDTITRGGLAAPELLAMELKASGSYVARSLGFDACEFATDEVKLSAAQTSHYDRAAQLWAKMRAALESYFERARMPRGRLTQGVWRQFWGAHQRFFSQLIMSIKAPFIASQARLALEAGMSVVIGLQSTGEAQLRMTEARVAALRAGEATALPSAAEETLRATLAALFPPSRRALPSPQSRPAIVSPTDAPSPSRRRQRAARVAATHKMQRLEEYWADLDRAGRGESSPASPAAAAPRALTEPRPLLVRLETEGMGEAQRSYLNSCLGGGVEEEEEEESDKNTTTAETDTRESTTEATSGAAGEEEEESESGEAEDEDDEYEQEESAEEDEDEDKDKDEDEDEDEDAEDDEYEDDGASGSDSEEISSRRVRDAKLWRKAGAAHPRRSRDEKLVACRDEVLASLGQLALPPSALDSLLDELGGPARVAEMTGRRLRVVRRGERFVSENRLFVEGGETSGRACEDAEEPTARVNVRERDAFMSGSKLVAIISDAASSGISLHADPLSASGSRRRVHFTLELAWSAAKVVQQLGRSHRTRQSSAPVFRLVMTELGGERRFASSVAARLKMLGAFTQGDRRALSNAPIAAFDVDTPQGLRALRLLLRLADEGRPPGDPHAAHVRALRELVAQLGLEVGRSASSNLSVGVFLNRMLGLEVAWQQFLFAWFARILDQLVAAARAGGELTDGVRELRVTRARAVERMTMQGGLELLKLAVFRGVSFDAAVHRLVAFRAERAAAATAAASASSSAPLAASPSLDSLTPDHHSGFFLSRLEQQPPLLALRGVNRASFSVVLPATGLRPRALAADALLREYHPVPAAAARALWDAAYELALREWATWTGSDARDSDDTAAAATAAQTTTTLLLLLRGRVLPYLGPLAKMLSARRARGKALGCMRVELEDGVRVVGFVFPPALEVDVLSVVASVRDALPGGDAAAVAATEEPVAPIDAAVAGLRISTPSRLRARPLSDAEKDDAAAPSSKVPREAESSE